MSPATPVSPQPLSEPLQRFIDGIRFDLIDGYQRMLREGMFANRSELRPSLLGRMAEAEAGALIQFFGQPNLAVAEEHGTALCQSGLNEQSVLRMGQFTRQLLVARLDGQQLMTVLNVHDA